MNAREAIQSGDSVWFPSANVTLAPDEAMHQFEDATLLDREVSDDVYTSDQSIFVVDGIGYKFAATSKSNPCPSCGEVYLVCLCKATRWA